MNRIFYLYGDDAAFLKDQLFLVGDIHNHCGISYGHGSIEDAVEFASQQLDFFSVTGHYAWPDIEKGDIPEDVVAYHRRGFERLRSNWDHYRSVMNESKKGGMIAFLSYEYHSFLTGDYTIVLFDRDGELPPPSSDGEEERHLLQLISNCSPDKGYIAFPHHIGYRTGYRGVNWKYYNDKASPLVEIISMHGASESDDAPLPYLHTMGPRCSSNTMRHALDMGFRFGVLGNTDHHNASPGSYGAGRTGLWCRERTRESVWDSLKSGRTVALSADPIEIFLDSRDGELEGFVCGLDRFRYVQLVSDGRVVGDFRGSDSRGSTILVPFTFGWGKKSTPCRWSVRIEADGLVNAIPRLRGEDVVAPLDSPSGDRIPAHFRREGDAIELAFQSDGNANTSTDGTQGVLLETEQCSLIKVNIQAEWNGRSTSMERTYSADELCRNEMIEYLFGFVSPCMKAGKAIGSSEASCHFRFPASGLGTYAYLRVLEENGSFAVSSPVFFN